MKRFVVMAGCGALIAGWLASSAPADLILHEEFNYAAGPLLGQTNPSNNLTWLRAAVSASPSAINVASGNVATITGIGDNSGSSVRLAFGQTINTGTVYYSLSLRADALTGSNNTIGGFILGLNNTGNSSQTTNPGVAGARLQARIDPGDPAKYSIGVFANRAAAAGDAAWSGPLTVGDTIFLVGSYTFNTGSATNDTTAMWINPGSLGDPSAPAPTTTDTVAGTDLSPGALSILLRQTVSPYFTLDNLRVGTDWASVTGATVPEAPAAWILLAVCGLIVTREMALKPLGRRLAAFCKAR